MHTVKKQCANQRIITLRGTVINSTEIIGNVKPSLLCYPLLTLFHGLISGRAGRMLSEASMAFRRLIHPIIMLLVPVFMDYKQVIESKNALLHLLLIWSFRFRFDQF